MHETSAQQPDRLATTTIVPTVVIGSPEEHYCSQLDLARQAIAAAKSAIEAVQVKRHTAALEEVIRRLRRDYGLSEKTLLDATEVRIRAQRKLGQVLAELKKAKPSGRNQQKDMLHNVTAPPTLAELGISKRDLSSFQHLASASDEIFESVLTKLRTETLNGKPRSLSSQRVVMELRAQLLGNGQVRENSSIVKPSDNWNFSPIRYPRLDSYGTDWGYIPGDLYANCLWYYANPRDVVVAPMAGTGQIQRVYDDRKAWMREECHDFELKLFDLNPRGSYKEHIHANDLTKGLPVERADYIIMDIPYFGMAQQQYSDNPRDIANLTNYEDWSDAMQAIAKNCAAVQEPGGRCTIVTPNYRNVAHQEILMVTDDIRAIWTRAGYQLFDKAYASRRIQQAQNPAMARMNNLARANRTLLTDISEVLTFLKSEY
jgi:ParB family chromosome partitioning protein